MVGIGIDFLDIGISYVRQGLNWVRDILNNIATWLPLDSNLSVSIVFLLVSLWLGSFITKKFVTRPFSGSYILWSLIISLSIFLNLMYL